MDAIINITDPTYIRMWEFLIEAEMPSELSDDENIVSINEDDETENWVRLA